MAANSLSMRTSSPLNGIPLQSNLPEHIDLISARQESYLQPAQLPHVTLADITQDLQRRGFHHQHSCSCNLTILENATLTDPFNGLR